MENQKYSIQYVAKLSGINAHTLRAWEKRYAAVVPERGPKGKRIYSHQELAKLQMLSKLIELGNTISDIANLSLSELEELYSQYDEAQLQKQSKIPREHIDTHLVLQNLIMALKFYKLDVISHELDKAKQGLGPREFALNILSPLLAEVGAQVEHGLINIAQEHALSAILKFHVGHLLYQHVENKNKLELNIAISTPEGELHEFGIMIAALLCSYYDVNFFYLGPNMPAESLAEAANQVNAEIILLGISKSYHQYGQANLDQYLEKLVELKCESTKVWLGGVSKANTFSNQERVELIPTLSMLDHKLSEMFN